MLSIEAVVDFRTKHLLSRKIGLADGCKWTRAAVLNLAEPRDRGTIEVQRFPCCFTFLAP